LCAGPNARELPPPRRRIQPKKTGRTAGPRRRFDTGGAARYVFREFSAFDRSRPAHSAVGGLQMKIAAVLSLGLLLFAMVVPSLAAEKTSPLDFKMKSIDGAVVDLSKYKGDVVLIVNVASKCGLTPQYAQLEKVYTKYKDKGLQVLGFPANEFGHQEPGTNAEIKTFCTGKYDVDFPMFSKIVVKGKGIHPLYEFLIAQQTEPQKAGEINWNFEKFLVGRDGKVVKRFNPRVKPDAPEVIEAIESELNKKS
jgi:glutathione peroxidase